MAEKKLTKAQIVVLRDQIQKGIKQIGDLLTPERFRGMTRQDKEDTYRAAKKIMNLITDNSALMINGVPLNTIFEEQYDATREQLVDMGFELSRLRAKTHDEVEEIKANYYYALNENQKASEYTFKEKVEIIDRTMKASLTEETALAFTPRTTLLQFNNDKFDSLAKSKGMTSAVKNTEKEMIDLLQTSINEAWNYDRMFKEAKAKVSEVFPDGVVTSPRKKKDGTYTIWKQPIETYTEDWMKAAGVMAYSRGTIASMLKGGADIAQIYREGGSTCPTCERIIRQGKDGKGLYSITGKTSGYPRLASASPFHVRCDCTTDVADEEYQSKAKISEKTEKEITSQEEQVKQQKKIDKQIKKKETPIEKMSYKEKVEGIRRELKEKGFKEPISSKYYEWETDEEYKSYFKDKWGIPSVSFEGMEMQVRAEHARRLDNLLTRFPMAKDSIVKMDLFELSKGLRGLNTLDNSSYESISAENTVIYLSKKELGASYEKVLKRQQKLVEAKWSPAGTDNVDYVMTHEYGHTIHRMLNKLAEKDEKLSKWLKDNAPFGGNITSTKQIIGATKLSEYARSNTDELFAEGFAQMILAPKELWTDFTKELSRMLKEYETKDMVTKPSEVPPVVSSPGYQKTIAERIAATRSPPEERYRFRRFNSKKEIQEYINDEESGILEWQRSWTKEENEALKRYKGWGYDDINYLLREGEEKLAEKEYIYEEDIVKIKDRIKKIDEALDRAELKDDIVTYRGFSNSYFRALYQLKGLERFVNMDYEDKGYGSTSLDAEVADLFANQALEDNNVSFVAIIKIPKHKNAGFLDGVFGEKAKKGKEIKIGISSESEFVLPRNTRYKILNATEEDVYDGKKIITLEVEVM